MTNWQKYKSWSKAMSAFIAARHPDFSSSCVMAGYASEFFEWLDSPSD